MEKNNMLTNQKLLLIFLYQNGIKLSKSTLNLLKNSQPIARQYFNLFTLSPKIINFCLKNPISLEPTTYDFLMLMVQNYDEATAFHYLKTILYQPESLIQKASDNRIPKITEKMDFIAMMAKGTTLENIELIYQAFIHRLFRNEFYQSEIEAINTDDFAKMALKNKLAILAKENAKKVAFINQEITEVLSNITNVDERNLIKAFFSTIIYYDDLESARYFLQMGDLTKYNDIFRVVVQTKNVDEFNIMRKYMIMLINYINKKACAIDEMDIEWLETQASVFTEKIYQQEKLYYHKGYLHIYFMLEKMQLIFEKAKAKNYILER